MTTALVISSLDQLAKLLESVGAKQEAAASRAIMDVLKAGDLKRKLADFLTASAPQRDVPAHWTGTRVHKLLPPLRAYRDGLVELAPKAGNELTGLVAFLERYEQADVTELAEAMRRAKADFDARKAAPKKKSSKAAADPVVIARYAARLRTALGRDGDFGSVLAELKADKSIRAPELYEVARQLLPFPPEASDRKKCFKAIEEFHAAARGFDLKGKASHGRSAA